MKDMLRNYFQPHASFRKFWDLTVYAFSEYFCISQEPLLGVSYRDITVKLDRFHVYH